MQGPRIYITVTNDTRQDQRMIKVANLLCKSNYNVVLIGRSPQDIAFEDRPFRTKLVRTFFNKGMLFYLEYNLRLIAYLLTRKMDGVIAVDLDTIIAGKVATFLKRKHLIFDAHEYFIHVPELKNKPIKKWIWKVIEKIFVRGQSLAFTVNESLAHIFTQRYHFPFHVLRNTPSKDPTFLEPRGLPDENIILIYQGALNAGRGLEIYVEAMDLLPQCSLIICGKGDIENELRKKIENSHARSRIETKGFINPAQLKEISSQCHIGLNLLDPESTSYFYSLANRYFDYIHAALPAIHMDFPEYRNHNNEYETSILIQEYSVKELVQAIQNLIKDPGLYHHLALNCMRARDTYSWDKESGKMAMLINDLFQNP